LLKDNANFVAPHGSAGGVIKCANVDSINRHMTTIRLVEPADKVQKRALARPGFPSQRKGFTPVHRHADPVEDRHGTVWARVTFDKICDAQQHGYIYSSKGRTRQGTARRLS
jgi:hypothetical protein